LLEQKELGMKADYKKGGIGGAAGLAKGAAGKTPGLPPTLPAAAVASNKIFPSSPVFPKAGDDKLEEDNNYYIGQGNSPVRDEIVKANLSPNRQLRISSENGLGEGNLSIVERDFLINSTENTPKGLLGSHNESYGSVTTIDSSSPAILQSGKHYNNSLQRQLSFPQQLLTMESNSATSVLDQTPRSSISDDTAAAVEKSNFSNSKIVKFGEKDIQVKEEFDLNSISSGIAGSKTLDQCAEVVIFMGDLNYRIKGNR
jgi:hypothetical protein